MEKVNRGPKDPRASILNSGPFSFAIDYFFLCILNRRSALRKSALDELSPAGAGGSTDIQISKVSSTLSLKYTLEYINYTLP